ncbi:hypothetical protein ALC62_03210 [Cyphomyrmex costatus]|uniref:DNA-directed DNA polymerase n=1 Tax=Cyphomyrmex costatus TaxID=456900 RepID=A0A151ILU3_9HYME|nr:hypothetical protein ALC62_03210 [Cyphomyrmex costatus]
MERDLIEQATLLDTREEYVAWEHRCDVFDIESLEEQSRIKRPRLSIGNRQSVIACIARLESLKDWVRERFVHVGAGYGLRWREIEAAFENRVLTGAVINSGHIEPRQFLENAGSVVLERVRGAIEKHGSVKANTAFNGEFVAGDKRTVMGINTKNCELYLASNVREYTKEKNENNIKKNGIKLRFIDSYKFLSSSLDKLASYLDKDKLKIVRSEFSSLSDEDFNLLTRKGVFPYEYVDCFEKLNESCLPPRESFHSSLTGDTVSESDYAHAANVWKRFSVRTLGEYSKYMRSYDSSEPSSYLMNYDVNNLYGWAMCQPLPYADFQWVKDAANFDANAIAPDSPTGYILEVDLEYPQHLHDAHTDLPFCPTRDKLPGKREDKLLATLYDKQRYVIHYRNLQQCTHHGLRVTKIHRVLQFAQSAWLRDYIELNTQFRTRAKNDFEKNLYKLMNNAVFGKTMENVRDLVDVKLITTWDGRYGAEALIAKPNFHSRSVFAENLIAVELRKLEVKFDKPIYVGMCILDISKVCLYEFSS